MRNSYSESLLVREGDSGSETPCYLRIRDAITERIRNGEYSEGTRLPTARELAARWNVGVATVGRALQLLQKEGLVETRVGAGTFVRQRKESEKILDVYCCLHPAFLMNQHHELAFRRLQGIISAANRRGVSLHLVSSANQFDPKMSHVGKYGFVFFDRNYEHDGFGGIAELVVKRKIPAIVCGHYPGPEGNIPCLHDAHAPGFEIATEHLLSLGHRRIALLNYSERDRGRDWLFNREGYLRAFRRRCLSPPSDLYVEAVAEGPSFAAETEKALEHLLRQRPIPTAIICNNDPRAFLVLELLAKRDIRVPEDISVVGFDNRKQAAVTIPPLTSVDPRLFDQGEAGVNYVVDLLRYGKAIFPKVIPRLVVRNSTRPL